MSSLTQPAVKKTPGSSICQIMQRKNAEQCQITCYKSILIFTVVLSSVQTFPPRKLLSSFQHSCLYGMPIAE